VKSSSKIGARVALPMSAVDVRACANLRECGPCQACCVVFKIKEIDKPPYQRCEHQCDKGCAIHATKPAECADYLCLWREGVIPGGDEFRPDNLGVIFGIVPTTRPTEDAPTPWQIDVIECRPGALTTNNPHEIHPRVIAVIEKIRQAAKRTIGHMDVSIEMFGRREGWANYFELPDRVFVLLDEAQQQEMRAHQLRGQIQ
jgi:hypothetical protein